MSTEITGRLIQLFQDASEGAIQVDHAEVGPGSIRRLGADSKTMLAFMVAIEDEFDFEWDDDVDPEIVMSFEALAEYLGTKLRA